MTATIRLCEDCRYETFILDDNLKERKCKHCGGLMRIIKREIKRNERRTYKKEN